jgi:hypothetical protein
MPELDAFVVVEVDEASEPLIFLFPVVTAAAGFRLF